MNHLHGFKQKMKASPNRYLASLDLTDHLSKRLKHSITTMLRQNKESMNSNFTHFFIPCLVIDSDFS